MPHRILLWKAIFFKFFHTHLICIPVTLLPGLSASSYHFSTAEIIICYGTWRVFQMTTEVTSVPNLSQFSPFGVFITCFPSIRLHVTIHCAPVFTQNYVHISYFSIVSIAEFQLFVWLYKVVQIWPGLIFFCNHNCSSLATPRQDWTDSNPSRREGGGCGFTLSRSHSCCAVRLVYTQISPGHIWTTMYNCDVSVAEIMWFQVGN